MTPDELRFAAACAWWLNSMIEKANEAKAFDVDGGWLMGYDVDNLAEQFEKAAENMEAP
jgi:hypothetical protein